MRYFTLSLVAMACSWGLEDPTAKVAQLRKEAADKEATYMRDWFARANLDAVPGPKIQDPADPRASELAAAAKVKEINDALAEVRQQRDSKIAAVLAPSVASAIPAGNTLQADTVAKILAAEALRKPAVKSHPGE